MNKGKNDFPRTTTTLIDRLRIGNKDDWEVFWKRYEFPIREVLRKTIDKVHGQLDYNGVNEYIGVVFQRIQQKIETYIHHGNSQFRGCIITWIRDAIMDELNYGKKWGWRNTELSLDTKHEDGDGYEQSQIEKIQQEDTGGEEQVTLGLLEEICNASIRNAANRFPWSGERKKIVKLLAATMLATKKLCIEEIAKECNTDPCNVSKAKAALIKKAQVYLAEYISDDNIYFEELERTGLDIDKAKKIISARMAHIDSMSNK